MIQNLRLQNFRSYTDRSFTFGDGVNIIVGPNGSGKTNLLEAVLVVARGGSYRVSDGELLQFDKPWFRLDAALSEDRTRTVKLATEPRQAKTYELDGKSYQRLTLPHMLPVVLFEPNHLQLLHGSPSVRRDYLDDILEQTSPGFISFRRNYRRVLAQRNALLKTNRLPSTQELFPWNLRLSELGATIARARLDLVQRFSETFGELYGSTSGAATKATITYLPKFPSDSYETHLLQKLESHAAEDAARGFTAYGPHREDFLVELDGKPAGEVASRGETRTAVLALKLLELKLLEEVRGQPPLLLLDDVFSELDARRRTALTSYLKGHQTFITTTDADALSEQISGCHVIPISPEGT
jgi:DNA replication and repair protein RecF